jgi:hypothetical protein
VDDLRLVLAHSYHLRVHYLHVVDDELTVRLCAGPILLSLFFKHHIAHDMDTLSCRVVGVVCL